MRQQARFVVIIEVRLLLATAVVATCLEAQQTPRLTVSRPSETLHYGFTHVAGVRELQDGRVIVVDDHDQAVWLVEAGFASMSRIGRNGLGPGEYRMPTAIFSLRGYTSGVLDGAAGRLLVIAPDGRPASTIDFRRLRERAGSSVYVSRPVLGADSTGFLYGQAQQAASARRSSRVADSAAIVRWHPVSALFDTVASIPIDPPARATRAGQIVASRDQGVIPFRTTSQWVVSHDARVTIVTPDPYQVTMIEPGRFSVRRRCSRVPADQGERGT